MGHPPPFWGNEGLLRRIFSGDVIKFSLTVAILGGTVITVINQGETLAVGDKLAVGKALLTYVTLYCMATFLALTDR